MKETSAWRKPSFSLVVGAFLLMLFTTVSAHGDKVDSPPPYYGERYRPQFHFSPERNWINDPNGMVFYDGEYHLCYQYNPEGDRWGHMSWAHAASKDMVHWEHLPLALREEAGIMAFSGSAVVDRDDTAGFRRGAADPALVAIYTGHRVADERQTQYLASSTDRGRTWQKFEKNPVLETEAKAFRDPKVFWHAPTKKWVMAVVLADEKKCRFYGSADLKKWVLLSEFGAAGIPNVKNWECPDLFELPVENAPGEKKWVLHINVGGGAIAGGSGGQYFVGNFDGTTFTNDNPPTQMLFTDYGKDFYAAVTWSNVPPADGRKLWIAWMNNWQYANDVPTHPWRGQMSIPRSIALKKFSEGLRLMQSPIAELKTLRAEHEHRDDTPIEAAKPLKMRLDGDCLEIIADFEPKDATEIGLHLHKGGREETIIGYEVRENQLFVDRTASGKVDFHADFSGKHIAPLSLDNGRIKLHIFVDRCSVEVFANGGRAVLTDLIFPSPESNGVELYAKGGSAKLISMDVWRLKSAWPEKR